jgi:chorismate-pyruvate lyase
VTAAELSNLQRTLLDSGDTVTHILESLTGEALVADVASQRAIVADKGNSIGVVAGEVVTLRSAVLKGRTTNLPYLYAESMFMPARLPAPVRARLERTDDPIGRVLADHGLKLTREALPPPRSLGPTAGSTVAAPASEVVWVRAYRLANDGLPVFAISEWFFRSVLHALERRRPG